MVEAIVDRGHEIGLHGYLHEKLAYLSEAEEEAILIRTIEILTRFTGAKPAGFRAPWFEINPWTPALLARHEARVLRASAMGDDVPYFHENGLVEIPGQWLLEDWEQFAFNADPAWGVIPENCAKGFDLWWREFEAMHDLRLLFCADPASVVEWSSLPRAFVGRTGHGDAGKGAGVVCARTGNRSPLSRASGGTP